MPTLIWSIVTNLFRPGFKDGEYGLNLRAAFNANFGDYFLRLPATVWSLHRGHPLAWPPSSRRSCSAPSYSCTRERFRRISASGVRSRSPWRASACFSSATRCSSPTRRFRSPRQASGTGHPSPRRWASRSRLRDSAAPSQPPSPTSAREPPPLRRSSPRMRRGRIFRRVHAVVVLDRRVRHRARGRERRSKTHVGPAAAADNACSLGGILPLLRPGHRLRVRSGIMSGALRLHSGDRTLSADVLRPRFYEVTDSGIVTTLYEGEDELRLCAEPGVVMISPGKRPGPSLTKRRRWRPPRRRH